MSLEARKDQFLQALAALILVMTKINLMQPKGGSAKRIEASGKVRLEFHLGKVDISRLVRGRADRREAPILFQARQNQSVGATEGLSGNSKEPSDVRCRGCIIGGCRADLIEVRAWCALEVKVAGESRILGGGF